MVDELPPAKSSDHVPDTTTNASSLGPALPYGSLRLAIRVAGVLLMFGGVIYLGLIAGGLLLGSMTYFQKSDNLYIVIASLVALGVGIFVFRVGLNMVRSTDASVVGSFSFLFALIYTSILMQTLPSTALFSRHPFIMYLLFPVCLALTYFILKRILLMLLFPKEKN